VSHTFVQREVLALRRRGVDVRTFTIRRARPSELLSRTDHEEYRTTVAVLPARWSALLTSHLTAFAASPRAYVGTVLRALGLAPPGLRGRVWQLFYFAEAIQVWRECEKRGVSHLHAHFANVGSDVALLAASFGATAGRGPSTWSFTMHGPAEFYDVTIHRLAEKVAASDFVACISDFCRSQLMGVAAREHWQKLHVVHCGVDTEEFASVERGPHTAGVSVLSVGRLVDRKGHAVLLEAVRRLRAGGIDVRAIVVGDGPARGQLGALAEELGIAAAVEFAGAVGQDEIRRFYESADVFCAPSFAEGVPVVLMEAMAMGLPVVATRVMGVPELVEDRVSGKLVAPGRADLLAEAIGELAAEPAERRRLGEAGRSRVIAEFDIDRSAAQLQRLFETGGFSSRGGTGPAAPYGAGS
jgi:colanic acid/amylovoran biosynthesis glycosyltransferase